MVVLGEAEVVVVVAPTSESLSSLRSEVSAPACGHDEMNAHGGLQGHFCVGCVEAMVACFVSLVYRTPKDERALMEIRLAFDQGI